MKLPGLPGLETTGILFVLLPGILAYVIVRLLTGRDKKIEAVEVVIYGLAYTLAINAIWSLLVHVGSQFPTPDIVGLSVTAVVFSVVLSWVINTGIIYTVLTKCRITAEAPFPTVWESSFRKTAQVDWLYATIELKSGRRIMGAVRFYSSNQEKGHVALDRAAWLDEASNRTEALGLVLLNADDIEYIQFLPDASVSYVEQQTGTKTDSAEADSASGNQSCQVNNAWLQSADEQAGTTGTTGTTT